MLQTVNSYASSDNVEYMPCFHMKSKPGVASIAVRFHVLQFNKTVNNMLLNSILDIFYKNANIWEFCWFVLWFKVLVYNYDHVKTVS